MAGAIHLAELEQELCHSKAQFEQWSASVLATARDCKASHLAKLRAGKGEMAALTERLQRAQEQAAHVQQQMAQDTEHEHVQQAAADSLATEREALMQQLAQLQLDVRAHAASVQQLQAECDASGSNADKRIATMDRLLGAYQRSLGLTLTAAATEHGDELHLEFTQIDPQQPQRPFGFSVLVEGDETYKVTRCEPQVPACGQLEAQLLRGGRGDLAAFARAMRAQFRALADADAAGGRDQGS